MRLSPPLTSLIVTWPFGATSDDPRLVGVVHRGVDLRAVVGTPVYAAADGAAVALDGIPMLLEPAKRALVDRLEWAA